MKITDTAVEAILDVMDRKQLDPNRIFFEMKILPNGAVGIGFSQECGGEIQQFGRLSAIIDKQIDADGVVIDFGEVNGKKGIIFLKEEE